ncbi:MAG: hypothetical protein ACFB51_01085 [Anaerolineae bacterium]
MSEMQNALDEVLFGAAPDEVARRYDLTQDEWERLLVAARLANASVAERSLLRHELKEHLMAAVEQQEVERSLERELGTEKTPNRRLPPLLKTLLTIGAVLLGLGMLATGLIIIGNNYISSVSSNAYRAGHNAAQTAQATAVPGAFDLPPVSGEHRTYLVQQPPEAVFGETFALRDMYLRPQNPYDDYHNSIVLIWEMRAAVDGTRYTFVLEGGENALDEPNVVDLAFPVEAGTVLASEHGIFYEDRIPGTVPVLRLSIVDRFTDERLTLANGEEWLTLRIQPAMTIPSVIVPEGGATATPIQPTAPPTP